MKKKAKIFNGIDVCLRSNCRFVEEGQNNNFNLWSQIQGGKNDYRKMLASLFYFYTETGGSIS